MTSVLFQAFMAPHRARGPPVIRVTRLNGERFALNPDLVERVEGHPDTVVFLVDGTKYIVSESVDEVLVEDRKSTRLNSSHANISYAVFCLKKKKYYTITH